MLTSTRRYIHVHMIVQAGPAELNHTETLVGIQSSAAVHFGRDET